MTDMAAGPFTNRQRATALVVGFAILATLAATILATTGSAKARPTCFGKPATIVGTNGNDKITTKLTAGKDVVAARGGNDIIQAPSNVNNHGKDIVCGDDGNDTIVGNNEAETLIGGPGRDDVKGGPGNDLIVGDNANPAGPESGPTALDELNGTGGNDFVVGDNYGKGDVSGASADNDNKGLQGLDGNDTVIGDDASLQGNATGGETDRVAGADGNDLVIGDSYAPNGVASGSGDDTQDKKGGLNAGPGDDLMVGDNYTNTGTATGGGDDTLAGADGGDFNVPCKANDPCEDTFYGDNFVASCAPNSSPQAQASLAVIRCEATRGGSTGGVDALTPDMGDDFMNGGPPEGGGHNGKDIDTCAGGKGIDTATRCTPIKDGAEHFIPYP